MSRKNDWYMKLDIRKYFDSVDHDILKRLLARRIKDRKVLSLFERILDTYRTAPGKGLPIGNLISQHAANFYLALFDHWIKEERRIKGYLRYMDDMLFFGPDKAMLKSELGKIQGFLSEALALEVKPNIQINRTARGIPFLGLRVFPHTVRLSPSSKKRFVKKFINFETRCHRGVWTEEDTARHMGSLFAFARTADSAGFIKNTIERFGVSF